MRLILLFVFLSVAAFGQSTFEDVHTRWTFYSGSPDAVTFQGKGYQRIVIEPQDTATYVYTISKSKKVWSYDSIWVTTEYNNTSSAINYSSGWLAGAAQTKFYNQDFQYGATSTTARSLTFSYTTDKPAVARFWSEHYSGHGKYQIKVDNGTAVEIDAGVSPFTSDKDRNLASWKTPLLPAGTHTITLTTSTQMVVDRFTVSALTLVPQ